MIEALSQPIVLDSDTAPWYPWVMMFVGIIFLALGVWFMFLYREQKKKQVISSREADEKGYSHGSFKGYWMRNRAVIFAFLVATFFLIGISIIVVGFQEGF